MNDPVVIQCADKYCVRNFVKARGYGHLLNDLIGVYDDPRDIPWNELPSRFVLKWNFGSGMNIICSHKENNFEEIARKLKKWKRCKYWLPYSEMQYKYCEKKIICEKYLSDDESEGSSLSDYKVYCFSGKPLCVMVMHDRFSGINIEFFDANWNPLENPNMVESTEKPTQRPACLQELLSASAKLSEGFPFVRCDFYIVGGKLYFGEMTFTPAGGLSTYETTINGKSMTEYLEIDA